MSKNTCRLIGILLMILSMFPIISGLYLHHARVASYITVTSLVVGIIMFILGLVFYKILKSE